MKTRRNLQGIVAQRERRTKLDGSESGMNDNKEIRL
jgi:hypothetical protein